MTPSNDAMYYLRALGIMLAVLGSLGVVVVITTYLTLYHWKILIVIMIAGVVAIGTHVIAQELKRKS